MADIKSFFQEKEKRGKSLNSYQDRLIKYKLTTLYRIGLMLVVLAAVVVLVVVQYKRHVYTDYDIVNSVEIERVPGVVDVRLQNAFLTYSRDGAHCTNAKGKTVWNQTYEIQDIRAAVCGDVAAIANYNGTDIYVCSSQELLGEINTTLPIREVTVSSKGRVTAVLADTDTTWVNTYDAEGNMIYRGPTQMDDSGYPMSVSLSPDGELLAVSYAYIDAGILKTNIAFYNFGPVGQSRSDYIVSVHSYTDLLVPKVQFMNNDTAFAVGDSRLMIYKGAQKPVSAAEYLLDQEIKAVFYSDKYIGLVFYSENSDSRYRMEVYNSSAERVGNYYFNIDYTDIFFEDDAFVIYNETECLIRTMSGIEKFNGHFSKTVNLMIPAGGAYRYLLMTDNSIDTIQLK